MWPSRSLRVIAVSTLLAGYGTAASAQSQSVAEFYRGKTINVLIGANPGGEYDLKARLVAHHIGRHIPGNPSVVAQNILGAGALKMMNYFYNQAPRDGTTLAMVPRSVPALQVVGLPGIQFDVGQFLWLGSISPVVETMAVWHTAGIRTVEDLRRKEVLAGATAKGSTLYTYPTMMNEVLGARFKLIAGYKGNNEINVAMERGEVEARNNSWSSWKTTHPEWLRDGKLVIIVQAGPRAPDLDAPSIEDLAPGADERALIEFAVSGTQLGTPLTITPGVPEERVRALRAAFDATMKDPAFLADATTLKFDVLPVPGEELHKRIGRIMSTPKPIAERARHLIE